LIGFALTGFSQTPPVTNGAVNSILSGNQRKVSARKDSVTRAADQYFRAGKPVKANAKDSIRPSRKTPPSLATISDTILPDPERFIPSLDHGSCKITFFVPLPRDSSDVKPSKTPPPPASAAAPPPHTPFLQVHGNVLYNLNYYSRIDTPYNEQNIYQHTVQTWLDILVKGEYPFRIFLTNHFSNSSLFRNYSDFNFSYNNNGFLQLIKDQLRQQLLRSLPARKLQDSLQNLLNTKWQKLKALDHWQPNLDPLQRMVEAREDSMRRSRPGADTSSAMSRAQKKASTLDSLYAGKQKEADSIRKEIGVLQQLLQTAHQYSQTGTNSQLAEIQRLNNPAELRKKLPELGLSDSSLPKGYKTLMAVKSFNLGRTVVNYSELSAKNISVNGVQAEYNPSNYYAFASGSVDYRFRDFLVQQPGQPRQYLNIFRVGKGLKDGNSVILTYFMGRRQLYNAATSDTSTAQVPSSFLMGFTVEGNYHWTKNILFTGEIAKSSSPSYTGDSLKNNSAGAQMLRMSDHSNEAWSTKLNAYFPETQTRIKAAYKHLAVNYQSFSIFTDGSAQSAWSASINQLLFKKQLDLTLGANTNDFSNPLIGQEYKSTTVFKSIQATFRKRNWPIISLGYFPSSQITKLGNGQYLENLFYTLVGNMTQSYTWHQLLMNTSLVYTQFYNRASDSGFTYFNTRNLMLSQSLFLDKFTFQLNASGASNQNYQLYTLEGKVQHSINKNLSLGAGIKYNKQTVYEINQLGYSAEATIRLNRLGQIQFSADKGFVPGMNNKLVSDNTGRLTYLKTF
jgi:hypothetical protein